MTLLRLLPVMEVEAEVRVSDVRIDPMTDDDKPRWQRTPPHQDPRFRNFRHPAMKTYGRAYVLQNPEKFGIDLEAWAAEHADGDPESPSGD